MCGIAGLIRDETVTHADQECLRHLAAHLEHRGPDGGGWFAARPRPPRHAPAQHHRPRGRLAAALQRGPLARADRQRRDLQLRRAAPRARSPRPSLRHATAIARPSCICTRSTATSASSICAACSRSRSGTAGAAACCWRAIAWARSRCSWSRSRASSCSLRSSRRLVRGRLRAVRPRTRCRQRLFPLSVRARSGDAAPGSAPAAGRTFAVVEVGAVAGSRSGATGTWRTPPPLDGDPATLIRAELERVASWSCVRTLPVGIALSGGLDSSAIAALASREYAGKLQAVERRLPRRCRGCDERDRGPTSSPITSTCRFHEVEVDVPSTAWRRSPKSSIGATRPSPTFRARVVLLLMRAAQDQGLRVMLQGHGGDELFWGYKWVREAVGLTQAKDEELQPGAAPRQAQTTIDSRSTISSRTIASRKRRWAGCIRRNGASGWRAPRRIAFSGRPARGRASDLRITRHDLRHLPARERHHPGRPAGDGGVDRNASAARGLSARRNGDGPAKLRPDHGEPPKAWLRVALRGVVPDWVSQRPKRGFKPPMREWHQALFARYGRLLPGGFLVEAGILRPEAAVLSPPVRGFAR